MSKKSSSIYLNELVFIKYLDRHYHIIGLVILPNWLSGATYLNFLVNTLCQFLESMPLAERLAI